MAETPPLFHFRFQRHITSMHDAIRSDWRQTILVCGKCSRKVGGGFGPKGTTSLIKALKEASNGRKGRKADIGLIETRCLKLCPKHRVVAINAAAPETWHLIEPGTPVDRVATLLCIGQRR